MKALRWHNREDIRVDDIEIPKIKPDEVLIKVLYSGICGSEIHECFSGPIYVPLEPHPLTGTCAPQTLGHEFGGKIVEIGSEVKNIKKDALVTVNPLWACGQCRACLAGRTNMCEKMAIYGLIGNGGHAEYAAVKADNCVPLRSDVPAEYVAFGEPAAVAFHAVNQAEIKPGSTVAILGAGPIGQLVAQYAKLAGVQKVIVSEIAADRIRILKQIGAADKVLNPLEDNITEAVMDETDGLGVDYAIECCGGAKKGLLPDTATQAIELTRAEGTTVIVGGFAEAVDFNFNNIVMTQRKVVGSWTWNSAKEYARAVEMFVEGKIKVMPLISKKIRIDNAFEEGIQSLRFYKDEQVKVLIDLT